MKKQHQDKYDPKETGSKLAGARKMNKGGRPPEKASDKVNLSQVERLAGLGLIDKEIGIILGVSQRTITRWKNDPEFLSTYKKGRLQSEIDITRTLYKKAMDGDVTSIIFWLKNRRNDKWSDLKKLDVDLGVKEGQEIRMLLKIEKLEE
jgi:hypothetical protein